MPIRDLHAVGGGSRSAMWLRLKADICGIPLRVPCVTEAACLGAALLAAVASGIYPDLEAAVSRTVGFAECIEPDAATRAAYDARYQLYRQVYPTLIPLLRRL